MPREDPEGFGTTPGGRPSPISGGMDFGGGGMDFNGCGGMDFGGGGMHFGGGGGVGPSTPGACASVGSAPSASLCVAGVGCLSVWQGSRWRSGCRGS